MKPLSLFKYIVPIIILGNLTFAQSKAVKFPKLKSHITLPLSIPIEDINSLVNYTVSGVIYEDNSYTDNDNDQFKVKVIKDGYIKITALKDNRLLINVPLKIWSSQGYGGLGYYVYQETNFGVDMQFVSSVDFKSDWTLETKTKAQGFQWTEEPVLDFGRVKIPVTRIVEKRLREQQNEFTTIIDEQIKEKFDLKPYLLELWNQFSLPINLSEEFNTWLKITPDQVYMTPMKIYSNYITASIGLDLFSETYIGRFPIPTPFAVSFPDFKLKNDLANDFNLKTTVNVSFEDAQRMADAQFVGQEFSLTSERNKVKIIDMKIFAEKDLLVLEVETDGQVKGTTTIKGKPYYDSEKQKIALSNVSFDLKTKNILKKSISNLFNKKIIRLISEEYGIPVGDLIDATKVSLMQNFNREYFPGIFIKGNIYRLEPQQVLLFEDFLTVVIDAEASLRLEVNGLSFSEESI